MTDLKQELVALENKYWTAMQNKDVAAALEMAADPCIVTGAQGVSRISKAQYEKMMTGAKWELKSFEITDVEFERLSDDVAVLGYKVHEELLLDGKPITLDAADASTWVRKDGRWVCALHTESPAGDPFNRDRAQ